MRYRRTAAWPLVVIYTALVVYASLFPFAGWRDQGDDWWAFLGAAWPRYWTWFDLLTNVAGYLPLGFLLVLAILRSLTVKRGGWVWLGCTLLASGLSLLMETLQQHLPSRVPSNVDWLANTVGAAIGCVMAWGMERAGWIARWGQFRSRWIEEDAHGSLTLVLVWPLALLFPAAVPLGLGQVLERLQRYAQTLLSDPDWMGWLPRAEAWSGASLSPLAEVLVVCMGLWVPVLLAFSTTRRWPLRLLAMGLLLLAGLCVTALSTALSFGPLHAWVWLSVPTQAGLCMAGLAGVAASFASRRVILLLALVALVLELALVNQAPNNAYFTQNLASWEQGRFVRFHGLAQWLGWIWPFAALAHVFGRLLRKT